MDLTNLAQQMLAVAPGAEAVFTEGVRVGRAIGSVDRVDLFLRMKLQSDIDGAPLLYALVSAPRDGRAPSAKKVTRGLRDASFTRREQQYLDAMVAWAARVLPDAPRTDIGKRKPPAWRAHIEFVLRQVVGGSAACVRACLDGQEDLLLEADASGRAQAMCEAMRDAGCLLQIDWNDDQDLVDAFAGLLEHAGVPTRLREQVSDDGEAEVRAVVDAIAAQLATDGLHVLELVSGMDAYDFVVVRAAEVEAMMQALKALRVKTKRR
jgi:hypothetical protein